MFGLPETLDAVSSDWLLLKGSSDALESEVLLCDANVLACRPSGRVGSAFNHALNRSEVRSPLCLAELQPGQKGAWNGHSFHRSRKTRKH